MINENCFLFHKWGKWREYKWIGTIQLISVRRGVSDKKTPCEELRQERTCKKCGKTQDILIK